MGGPIKDFWIAQKMPGDGAGTRGSNNAERSGRREWKVESKLRRGGQVAFERLICRSTLYFLPSPLYFSLREKSGRQDGY